MKRLKNHQGFTLIELVMIIVILAILAVVAVPKFFNLSTQATAAAEKGVVGGVRAGVQTYIADPLNLTHTPPATLDAAAIGACTTANPCFGTVLGQGGITQDWTKVTATTYRGPVVPAVTYTYTPATGSFQ